MGGVVGVGFLVLTLLLAAYDASDMLVKGKEACIVFGIPFLIDPPVGCL